MERGTARTVQKSSRGRWRLPKAKHVEYKRQTNNSITEPDEINRIWKLYTENLFQHNRAETPSVTVKIELTGPCTIKSKVEYAIKTAKSDKAQGPVDMLAKYSNNKNLKRMTKFFNRIYNTGQIPKDWLKTTFEKIPKNSNVSKCCDHRPICLMSHKIKIFQTNPGH
jgi:hypothetical protein